MEKYILIYNPSSTNLLDIKVFESEIDFALGAFQEYMGDEWREISETCDNVFVIDEQLIVEFEEFSYNVKKI